MGAKVPAQIAKPGQADACSAWHGSARSVAHWLPGRPRGLVGGRPGGHDRDVDRARSSSSGSGTEGKPGKLAVLLPELLYLDRRRDVGVIRVDVLNGVDRVDAGEGCVEGVLHARPRAVGP